MKVVILLERILLGAIFLVFGLNKLIPMFTPPPPTGLAADMMGGLAAAGYFFPMLALVEVACGLLLLIGRFVPLALTLLAPIIVNIFAYHLFLAPAGLPLALLLMLLAGTLAWFFRDSYRELFRSEPTPRFRKGTGARPATRPHEPPGREQPAKA